MAATLKQLNTDTAQTEAPVIVIGSGPVGVRLVNELYQRRPSLSVKMFGNEPWRPYDRVRLSSLLAGDADYAELFTELAIPEQGDFSQFDNCPITEIHPSEKYVVDIYGVKHRFSHLVIATGSTPHVPGIRGIDLPGCFTFRDMNDAQQLVARRTRTRRTVVLGGGLLGIEAARAMQRANTEVVLVEHGRHLMMNQLDDEAAERLREKLLAMGIQVLLGSGVTEVLGDHSVTGVRLRNGLEITCDTIVIATGIRPNVGLAKQAELRVRRGIDVNDRMQTQLPYIYAIGECAEHRGRVYGLVAPGYEQAAVAAHSILGGDSQYNGSIAATRLKVVGHPVFSMGAVTEETMRPNYDEFIYEDVATDSYRKLVIKNRKLIGAVALGDWAELGRVQDAVRNERRIWPWQLLRFKKTGSIWPPHQVGSIHEWPAQAVVCNCTGITRGQLSQLIVKQGCSSMQSLSNCSGAGSVCGSCRPMLSELVGRGEVTREAGGSLLLLSGVLALLAILLMVLMEPVPVADSVQQTQLEQLWTDGFWKQVTGFTILGLTALVILMSLRKRVKPIQLGVFSWWRILHTSSALLALVVLALHTGLQLGENLNGWLMINYLAIAGVGVLAGIAAAKEQAIGGMRGRKLRAGLNGLHIVLFWPLPVLLGFHIVSAYYF